LAGVIMSEDRNFETFEIAMIALGVILTALAVWAIFLI